MTRTRRTRAMFLIAGCFAISAVARFSDPAFSSARAAETEGGEDTRSPVSMAAASREDAPLAETTLMRELMARAEELDARVMALDARERTLEAAASSINEQIAVLEALERRLAEIVDIASTASESDVEKLVAAYQAMDGKKAAAIVETMDVSFAAGLLARMRGDSAAAILAALPPDVAYAITANIAGRNAANTSN